MMARLMRLLRQWPLLHHHCCSLAARNHLLSEHKIVMLLATSPPHRLSFASLLSPHRCVPNRSRGLKSPNALKPSDLDQEEESSGSYSDSRKSRNERKREARRAVRWGTELAAFSTSQIKRIIRLASLEREVFDAIMLVKRLGPDVREGKRRQYNLIGKLLRDAKPELMDALILATKDGDWSRLEGLSVSVSGIIANANVEESEETEDEEDEEVSDEFVNVATRWFDGLVNKDMEITNEVYAIRDVDFDRQELRKLVRKVHVAYEGKAVVYENEQEGDAAIMVARRSLTRFLRAIAKRIASGPNFIDL